MHRIMKIAVGADHGGFLLKVTIVRFVKERGFDILDFGTHSTEPSDYPDFARSVSEAVLGGKAERGILLCGSGVGACVAANKFPGIKAAVCHDTFSAHQGVEDDDMNVLCLGGRVIGHGLAKEIVNTFLLSNFSGAERHLRRLNKVKEFEREFMRGRE